MKLKHSYPIERINSNESGSVSVSESVSTRFFRQAAAINKNPFDSDTDSDPDPDGNSNTPYSAKTLCFRKKHFVDIYGTAVFQLSDS